CSDPPPPSRGQLEPAAADRMQITHTAFPKACKPRYERWQRQKSCPPVAPGHDARKRSDCSTEGSEQNGRLLDCKTEVKGAPSLCIHEMESHDGHCKGKR